MQHMRFTATLAEYICTNLGSHRPRILVAICGWADTGKSTLAKDLSEVLKSVEVDTDWISTDSFMKDRAERNALGITGYNSFSLDSALLSSTIDKFIDGKPFAYRPYDNKSGKKLEDPRIVTPEHVLIVEGIHALNPSIEPRFALKIFIDSDEPTLREMRQRANVFKRGMNPIDAASRIQSEWEDFSSQVLPRKQFANLLVRVSNDYKYSTLFAQGGPGSLNPEVAT
jgi:uridine kinase